MALFGGEPINPGYTCPDTIPLAVPIERFSEDPDYRPPRSEITYEVEAKLHDSWVGINLEFNSVDPSNLGDVRGVRDRIVAEHGYETRILRIETIRSQIT